MGYMSSLPFMCPGPLPTSDPEPELSSQWPGGTEPGTRGVSHCYLVISSSDNRLLSTYYVRGSALRWLGSCFLQAYCKAVPYSEAWGTADPKDEGRQTEVAPEQAGSGWPGWWVQGKQVCSLPGICCCPWGGPPAGLGWKMALIHQQVPPVPLPWPPPPASFVHALASICVPLDPRPLQQKLYLSTGPHGLPWHTGELRKCVLMTGLCCLGSFGSQSMNPGSATCLAVPLCNGPRPP